MKTLVRILVIVVVLTGGGAAAWLTLGPSHAAVEVQTLTVGRGSLEETVLASGALEAASVTSVGAQVSGTIKTLNVALGDSVAAGDVIAEIDSLDQENAVKSAEAQLANIAAQKQAKEAEVAQIGQALDRATRLHDQALLSDSDFLAAEVAVQTATAQIAGLDAQMTQATLAVDAAKLNLSRTTITAPVAGTIVAVLVTEGQSVNAAQTAPTIVKIADLDQMVIKAEISEADVTRVAPGQSAYFTILGEPDARIDATLLNVEPAPKAIATEDSGLGSDSAVYYNGLLAVDNPDHKLRIAMTAQVTIVIDAVEDGLVVPASVLGAAKRDGSYEVQVLDPATGATRPATVNVGINNNINAEVTSGLSEGDLIVTGALAAAGVAATGAGGTGSLLGGGPPGGFSGRPPG